MRKLIIIILIVCLVSPVIVFPMYCMIGTNGNIPEILARAPGEMPNRGWEILRYEGYEYDNFGRHGGVAWYHVRNIDNHSIQYRVRVSLWDGQLEYTYGEPERLSRFNLVHNTNNMKYTDEEEEK